ncbi:(2Fe-2S)-binding protein [Thalassoroseus pseudoceratinae]|uniref:(2Fe-2S)-binding protein n=1 Tax=Thalassoroseus pseudoceratinae TaxID=2713176 RepID=UPI00142314D4|nr:(2Fe-2S)-binding protein [Thalassoroseus pseudoceratinae]
MRDREERTRSGPPEGSPTTSGFNRRDFLKGSGAAAAATALVTATETVTAQDVKSNVRSAEPQKVTLNVNGEDHTLEIEPRVTLLDALRNDLSLTGCKDVDERDAAGADTVIIDGKAVLAGSRLAIECEGQKIRTVESLVADGNIDPVVASFVKHDAQQCGFCTPGFVMAMRAFVDKNPKASDEEIREGLGGNICRCGTYDGIMKCALELTGGA